MRPKTSPEFPSFVHATLSVTPVQTLLRDKAAVVLERIARGGGSTNWYYCRDSSSLSELEAELWPGSVVSFYFDDRMARTAVSAGTIAELRNLVGQVGELILGTPAQNGLALVTTIVDTGCMEDIDEFVGGLPPSAELFFGVFPAADDDGVRAVTVVLPDNDGVVRRHPH